MKVLLIVMALVAGAATVQAGSTYDWRTGNSYQTFSYGGQTHVYGFNGNTGSSWNTTIQRNGNMNGFDSSGNYWNYNRGSNSYWNSNGTTCFGGICN